MSEPKAKPGMTFTEDPAARKDHSDLRDVCVGETFLVADRGDATFMKIRRRCGGEPKVIDNQYFRIVRLSDGEVEQVSGLTPIEPIACDVRWRRV